MADLAIVNWLRPAGNSPTIYQLEMEVIYYGKAAPMDATTVTATVTRANTLAAQKVEVENAIIAKGTALGYSVDTTKIKGALW